MKYKLIGKHKDGEDWDFAPIFSNRADAESRRQIEINAYTFKGVCDWEFEIIEMADDGDKMLTKEQALKIITMLEEYRSATDNILYQYMGIPSKITDPNPLDIKLDEIDEAIRILQD